MTGTQSGDATRHVVSRHSPAGYQPEAPVQEVLAGLVERVTFHNADNGFCVLRVKARGHRDLVTVVGHAAVISAGEWLTASGEWVNDRTHGQQFKARFMRTSGKHQKVWDNQAAHGSASTDLAPAFSRCHPAALSALKAETASSSGTALRPPFGSGVLKQPGAAPQAGTADTVRSVRIWNAK